MSYESEDRYWTDYLRVALPVIGLLLMLALFWWWAQQFIGDNGDPDDVAQATQTIIATLPAPTPTNTVPVVVEPTEGGDETPTAERGNPNENGGSPDETPGDGGQPQDCGFVRDQEVVVTTDDLNLREEPVIDPDNVRGTLSEGATVRIVEDCYVEDEEGNQFWRVRDQETSLTGYVAGEFLAPIEEE